MDARQLRLTTRLKPIPTVAVLLATYNGMQWLPAQVASILEQVDVEVRLFVSDDGSTDGTPAWLTTLALNDSRIILLPQQARLGAPGKNFYRLLMDADINDHDFVALADQDDIWLLNKLSKQIELASMHAADGVSSNVVAYWHDGSRALIDKAQPLRQLDFLFESAGPGCSFLLTNKLFRHVKDVLINNLAEARTLELHDWLIYTLCRVSNMRWYIDGRPTLKYRQHESNAVGVNLGPSAWFKRLGRIRDGWYRSEVRKLARIAKTLTQDPAIDRACDVILGRSLLDRVRLLGYMNQSRRAFDERLFLGLLVVFGVF
jgi:rhamnosyltransferase